MTEVRGGRLASDSQAGSTAVELTIKNNLIKKGAKRGKTRVKTVVSQASKPDIQPTSKERNARC